MSAKGRQLRKSDLVTRKRIDRRRLMQGATAVGTATVAASVGLPMTRGVAAQNSGDADIPLLRFGAGVSVGWVRNFNPLVPDALEPTKYGVHEPLFVYARTTGEITPWLATDWGFNENNTVLTFNIREGVKWSDGTPFTASDVVFTMNLLKENTALSGSGGIRGALEYVASFEAPDPTTFVVNFNEVFTPGLSHIGGQSIVPEHMWKDLDDPVTFANENPVGTGPFTEVGTFRPQYYELLRNPNYWQRDKPYIAGVACPSYRSNQDAILRMINDEFDWMSVFVPDVENTFVAENPEYFRYWYPLISSSVGLYFNHTMPVFDNVDVRKAMSMVIDREQICEIAQFGDANPSDATGMSNVYEQWKSQEVIEAGQELVSLNIEQANQMLDQAGYSMDGDIRRSPDGEPMEFELVVPSGWSDWVQTVQLLSQNLAEVGINISVDGVDPTTWSDRTFTGDFELSLGFSTVSPTPYDHFREMMSSETVAPVGEPSPVNWHRFGSDQVTEWLGALVGTSDESEQTQLVHQMQQEFLEQWPVVPIYQSPSRGEMNTIHLEGFPSEDDPYALPGPADEPSFLLTSTRLRPRDD